MLLAAETDPTAMPEASFHVSKLIQPRDHKAKIVVWADLTVDDVDRLNESLNVDHNKQVLADIFHLDAWREDPKQAIIMDLYYYTLQFARDNNFSREKTSTFFSIMKKTHEVAIETPFGNLEQTFRYFKEVVLCHAVNRPPHSIELFSVDEVRKLTEYAINTYFRHFKMYKYAFTPLVRLDLSINYVGVPVASPEPTDEGEVGEEASKDQETATEEPEGEAAPEVEGEKSGGDGAESGEVVQIVTEADTSASDPDTNTNTNSTALQAEESEAKKEAKKELRAMIQTYLAEEIKKVKVTVEEELKNTEESLNKKIESAENASKKSPRKDSAKRKK
ncbi:cilia- and flagella-associated protein 119-like isoform X1 [Babylonia areolata]|uniref:cilia- and flagella-associated protein 119-like isoform X1 n=1 Tax=Babylonia areolata TaxID=304850 RepID=UPI003FD0132C